MKFPSPESLKVLTPTKTYQRTLTQHSPPFTSKTINFELSPDKDNNGKFILETLEIPDKTSPTTVRRSAKRKLFIAENSQIETPRKKKLRKTIDRQKKLLNEKRSKICKLRKRAVQKPNFTKTLVNDVINGITYPSTQSRTLVRMQTLHKKREKWLRNEQEFAIKLYYKSPSAYKFLRQENIVLPSISTIKEWITSSKFMPGFSPTLFSHLKLKTTTMIAKDKMCIICFDEMAIKSFLEYSKALDEIEGFEDMGTFGRKNVVGKQAMVFMARGLYSQWKMPLAYFICRSNVPNRILKDLIVQTIEKVIEVGLVPKAVVCDQGTNNTAAIKNLGSTVEKPFFFVKGCKIYSIFDVPHLFKCIRNNFLKHDFIYNNNNKVRFEDIVNTYHIDKLSGGARALCKLTDHHINPGPFKSMSCKLALQLFSHSVSAAIKTCSATGQLKSVTATHTAKFVADVNNCFDCLNSRSMFCRNPYNASLYDKNPIVKSTLQSFKNHIKKTRKIDKNDKILKNPACFEGIQWSINSIILLQEDEKLNGFEYLLTTRLNQDIIENFFSIIRQRGGYNKNPTVRTFRSSFRINCITNLMKPPETANCEPDYDMMLTCAPLHEDNIDPTTSAIATYVTVPQPSPSSTSASSPSSAYLSETTNKRYQNITLEDCATTYFAGYLVKKCLEKFNCTKCTALLLKSDRVFE